MNKNIMKQARFGQMVKNVESGLCPFCKEKINESDFVDANSRQEYKISGLCQKCQNTQFGPDKLAQNSPDSYHYDKPYRMTCGSEEAEKRRYKKLIGKNGKIWLVAIQPDAGGNIYVEGGPNSDGFGGRTLAFELESGEILKLKGPWHTNSDALFNATGYDIRDKHLTFGVIAMKRKDGWLHKVIYKDSEAALGPFNRIEQLAQKHANELKKQVFYYSETVGGSSCGSIEPLNESRGTK